MIDSGENMVQLNIRLPETVFLAIESAAAKENKSVSEFVRFAAIVAVCHTNCGESVTVFVEPGAHTTLERVKDLGMIPIAKVGSKESEWRREVRVPLNKNNKFLDLKNGEWVLTPQGLKFWMGGTPLTTAKAPPTLAGVVSEYNPDAENGFFVLKPFPNTYAQIFPNGWPQGTGEVQYRFFKQNKKITPELYLNVDAVKQLGEKGIKKLKKSLEKTELKSRNIEWLEKGRRLRVSYNEENTNESIANGMLILIKNTFSLVDPVVRFPRRKRSP